MARSVVEMGMELLRKQNAGEDETTSAGDEQMSEQDNETGGEDEPAASEESGGETETGQEQPEQEDQQMLAVLSGLVDRLDQIGELLDGLLGRAGGSMSAGDSAAQYAASNMKED